VRGFRKLSWVEAKLFARDPLAAFFALGFPLLTLVVLAAIFAGSEPEPGEEDPWRGAEPIDYYVPAYVGIVLAAIGLISLPVHLASYRERGVLKRFHASSLPAWTVLGSQAIVGVTVATLGSLLLYAVGVAAYGARVPDAPAGAVVVYLVSALAFIAVGFLLGALMPTARAAQGLGLILFFANMFLSGADGPREIMPQWMKSAGEALPLTHSVTALQDAWLGFGWNWAEIGILCGMLIVALAVAVRLFRWE
jgi:ABC-2 type transport system permease protein